MSFTNSLISRLSQAVVEEPGLARDRFRFGKLRFDRRLYSWARSSAKWIGFGPYRWVNRVSPKALQQWDGVLHQLEWMYQRFGDDESRQLLVDLVAFRLMGSRAIRLPLNTPAYHTRMAELESLRQGTDSIKFGYNNWSLNRFDLHPLGFHLHIYSRVPSIMAQFSLQQYACSRLGVRATPSDIVIDGGGCFGDTALYFAHLVGEQGRVYSFEFVESNLKLFQQNLSLNPDLSSRIQICRHPLWSTSDMSMYVHDRGPASTVSSESTAGGDAQRVTTLTIDDLVERNSLPRVDFIKMDIEGAECESLKGAERTIRRFKPQLAICVYHRPADFVDLAKLIDQFEPNYQFALGHFTTFAEETVLFAKSTQPRSTTN